MFRKGRVKSVSPDQKSEVLPWHMHHTYIHIAIIYPTKVYLPLAWSTLSMVSSDEPRRVFVLTKMPNLISLLFYLYFGELSLVSYATACP